MPGKDSRTFVYVLCHAIILCFMGSSCALVDEYFKEKVEEETRNRVAAPGGTPSEEENPPETSSDELARRACGVAFDSPKTRRRWKDSVSKNERENIQQNHS